MYGIEVNSKYCQHATSILRDICAEVINADFFTYNFATITNKLSKNDEVLIIGNPPWVTNSTVSNLDGSNLPLKSNFKGFSGIDAITGSANFDICEFILLELSKTFCDFKTTIAMLCKTSVARNTFSELCRNNIVFSNASILKFNAKNIFDVAVDSCLFVLSLGKPFTGEPLLRVANFSDSENTESEYRYKDSKLVSTADNASTQLDGKCEFSWRQGVKHDCSKVMEMKVTDGCLVNGYKEVLDIEETYVFPLVKSSAIKSYLISDSNRKVIVTQKKVNGDTSIIREIAPRTWDYLQIHADEFLKRKSVIYKNAPMFGMFGVGDYSYSPYKVGVSGFYKEPRFALLSGEKSIMMDDTCYFLGFQRFSDAYIALLILNSKLVQDFLKEIAFIDSKRPYTKKILQRIELSKCLDQLTFDDFLEIETSLGFEHQIKQSYIDDFVTLLSGKRSCEENIQLAFSL